MRDEAFNEMRSYFGTDGYRAVIRYIKEAHQEACVSCTSLIDAPDIYRKQGEARALNRLLGAMERSPESTE